MARTSKKAKAVTVATMADAAADAAADVDVRSVEETEAVTAVETGVETASVAASGETVFIPLNKLKKSPRNARKTPHSEADIEAYAASIAAKGILQNLVVEPELEASGDALRLCDRSRLARSRNRWPFRCRGILRHSGVFVCHVARSNPADRLGAHIRRARRHCGLCARAWRDRRCRLVAGLAANLLPRGRRIRRRGGRDKTGDVRWFARLSRFVELRSYRRTEYSVPPLSGINMESKPLARSRI